ncbi:MAG: D-alanyl-D-alanine carboxypeptidase, partial [Clostridiales bacterium]|nr:D-alanyl-D-alanine carboxypeptidase [Clostridiales bacterium]
MALPIWSLMSPLSSGPRAIAYAAQSGGSEPAEGASGSAGASGLEGSLDAGGADGAAGGGGVFGAGGLPARQAGAGPVGVFETPDLPEFDAEAYILMNRKTGQTICSKNPEKKMYPASTTKIMTAILALEMGDLNMEMTASAKAIRDIGADGSNIGIIAGEVMRLDNLIDALIVKSANEAANIVAENLAGSQEGFIALMNQKAAALGALNTNFVNTHGNHDSSHYTTAYDLALISGYAMSNSLFREYAAKRSIILSPTNKHSSWERLGTTNALLLDESEKNYAVTGVKTGYTSNAGYCLVATGMDANGTELLCVVLGVWGEAASARRFNIASSLLEYGFANFGTNTFIGEDELVETISVLGGESVDSVDAVASGAISLFLPVEPEKWNVSKIEYVKSEITAPVAKGEILGYVELRNNGLFAGRVNIVAARDVLGAKGAAREPPRRDDTGSAMDGLPAAGAAAFSGGGTNGDNINAGGLGSGAAGIIGNGAAGGAIADGGGRAVSSGAGGDADAGGSSAGAAGGAASGSAGAGRGSAGAGAAGADDGEQPLAVKIAIIALMAIMSLAAAISVIRAINKVRAARRARLRNKSFGARQIPADAFGGRQGGRQAGAARPGGKPTRARHAGGKPAGMSQTGAGARQAGAPYAAGRQLGASGAAGGRIGMSQTGAEARQAGAPYAAGRQQGAPGAAGGRIGMPQAGSSRLGGSKPATAWTGG